MKKGLLIVLCLVLAASLAFAGCKAKEEATEQGTEATEEKQTTEETEETTETEEEMAELVMVFISIATDLPDSDMVFEAMNEITMAEINAKVEYIGLSFANYKQQATLMLAAQEQIDILNTSALPFGDFTNQAAQGQLLPLNDLLAEYGQGALDVLGKYVGAGTIDGEIVALPTWRDMGKSVCFAVRKDLIEEYDIDLSGIEMENLASLNPVLQALKDNVPEGMDVIYPGQSATHGIEQATMIPYGDSLGGLYYFTGVLLDATTSDNMVVTNYIETEKYRSFIEIGRDWFEKGYTYSGIIENTEEPYRLVKSGKLASLLYSYHPALQRQANTQCGYEMELINLYPGMATTETPAAYMYSGVSYTEYPVAVAKFLNLIYTNAEINDLWNAGIEDVHYVVNDEGNLEYPEGVTAENTGYSGLGSWVFGNSMLGKVWASDDTEKWVKMAEFNENGLIPSVALGFQFDSSAVETQMAACINVYDQYARSLGQGVVDPDEYIPIYLQALKDAGVDDILAEKQAQLDAWAEANGVK